MSNKRKYYFGIVFLLIGISILISVKQFPVFADNNIDAISEYDITDDIKSQLDSNDRNIVRSAINSLGKNSNNRITVLFEDLWSGKSAKMFLHPELFNDSVVRLTLAKELLVKGKREGDEYSSFIKSKAYSRDWIIRANAADGLAVVDDKEAVDLLFEIVFTPHQQVALRAVWALEKIALEGNSSILAIETINQLLTEPEITDEKVKEALHTVQSKISKKLGLKSFETDNSFVPHIGNNVPAQLEIPQLLSKAEEGDPQSQHILGETYLVGVGTEPNYEEAKKWLLLAVEQDFAPAKASLAQMYLSGRGVEINKDKAKLLLNEAKAQGYQPASDLLRILNN